MFSISLRFLSLSLSLEIQNDLAYRASEKSRQGKDKELGSFVLIHLFVQAADVRQDLAKQKGPS